jgi:hypothetical protein
VCAEMSTACDLFSFSIGKGRKRKGEVRNKRKKEQAWPAVAQAPTDRTAPGRHALPRGDHRLLSPSLLSLCGVDDTTRYGGIRSGVRASTECRYVGPVLR